MNFKNTWLMVLVLSLFPLCSAVGQNIDQSIAQELGLVKSSRPALKSGVFEVELNIGKRMELVFPEQGSLSLKSADKAKFEILNINNSLFVEALEKIDKPVTAIFTLRQSQQIVLLNIRTVSKDILVSSRLIHPPSPQGTLTQNAQKTVPPVPGPSQVKGYEYDSYVQLTAFAARSAYAPDRLVAAPKGVRQIDLNVNHKQVQKISRERRLKLKPLSSWIHRGLHITVLEITNTSKETLNLTADVLRGDFVARSFQHNRIGASDNDRYSAAYVISLVPFKQAIEAL